MVKNSIGVSVAAIGAIIAKQFGGWDMALTSLVIFMTIDFVLGVMAAGVFHKSKKSDTGALSSSVGWKGLCKKLITLLLVVVSHRMDLMMGTDYIRTGVAFGFMFFELVSILELAKLMDVPLPKILYDAVEMIGEKVGIREDDDDEGNTNKSTLKVE